MGGENAGGAWGRPSPSAEGGTVRGGGQGVRGALMLLCQGRCLLLGAIQMLLRELQLGQRLPRPHFALVRAPPLWGRRGVSAAPGEPWPSLEGKV